MNQLITPEQAAHKYGVTVQDLAEWRRQNVGPDHYCSAHGSSVTCPDTSTSGSPTPSMRAGTISPFGYLSKVSGMASIDLETTWNRALKLPDSRIVLFTELVKARQHREQVKEVERENKRANNRAFRDGLSEVS